MRCLTTETVQGAALSLQGVDNVQRCDGLALGVLSVGDGITDDALEEGLEDGAGLLVDHYRRAWLAGCHETRLARHGIGLTGRDTLDTTTTGETSDGGLGDTLDVVTKNLAVTLGTSLSEALAALATCLRALSADMRDEKRGETGPTRTRRDEARHTDRVGVQKGEYSRPVMLICGGKEVWVEELLMGYRNGYHRQRCCIGLIVDEWVGIKMGNKTIATREK